MVKNDFISYTKLQVYYPPILVAYYYWYMLCITLFTVSLFHAMY